MSLSKKRRTEKPEPTVNTLLHEHIDARGRYCLPLPDDDPTEWRTRLVVENRSVQGFRTSFGWQPKKRRSYF